MRLCDPTTPCNLMGCRAETGRRATGIGTRLMVCKEKNVPPWKRKPAGPSAPSSPSLSCSECDTSAGGVELKRSPRSIRQGANEYPLSSFTSTINSKDGSGSDGNLSNDKFPDLLLSTQRPTNKCKSNGPEIFPTTMPKILPRTCLRRHATTRAHPHESSAVELDERNIKAKARRVLREEMKKKLEKGRVKKVVPKDYDEARKALELEKRLRKRARGG
ncbi:hypothetical protein HOY80DRAFT_1005323 [Tuber brumale]|nr:hypothetical protein HOY80DRAFT_1005323 [Tuber brumale]